MLNPQGGVIDDLIVYFLREDFFRLVVNAAHARQGPGVDAARARPQRRSTSQRRRRVPSLAHDRRAGPERAREGARPSLPTATRRRRKLEPFDAVIVAAPQVGDAVRRAHRLHRRGRLRDRACRRRRSSRCGTRWSPPACKPAGLGARDTLRLEAGMNLYGQDMDETRHAARSRPRLDRRPGEPSATSSARPRSQAQGPARAASSGLVLREKAACCAPPEGACAARRRARSPAARSARRCSKSIALARVPRGVAVGDTVHVEIRDKKLAARVVKLPFVRNGKVLRSIERHNIA